MPKYKHTPKEARKLWVDDLINGGHAQGTEWLCYDGKFCCIGRACEVMIAAEGEEALPRQAEGESVVTYGLSGSDKSAPVELQEWLGMPSTDGTYSTPSCPSNLLTLNNDRDQMSLPEIGRIIASSPPGLFSEEDGL